MQQLVLLADGPGAREAEALAQPQHGLEALDRALRRVEGPEATDLGHVLLHSEMVALDALLQVLGHVVDRGARQKVLSGLAPNSSQSATYCGCWQRSATTSPRCDREAPAARLGSLQRGLRARR